jgi:CelD/BcsL family acetyltransferase involved in cellulose biosynthesis
MNFSLYRQMDLVEGQSEAWNRLLQSAATNVPFLQFEYVKNWWQTLGGGEWENADLRIIFGRDDHGQLLGIAPFFRTQLSDQSFVYMFIGSIEISDYLDFIVAPENRVEFTEKLFRYLHQQDANEWSKVDLYNLPDWTTNNKQLKSLSEEMGWGFREESLQPCPMIALEGDWDTYLMSLKKKQRHELRRKLRKAESYPEEVSFHILTKDDPLEESIATYIQLMGYDPRKSEFLNPKMEKNIRELINIALAGDWLVLAFLEVGGTKIAANMNFDYGNRLWVYNSGIHPDYYDLSPGWVLLGMTIQWAIEHGRNALDFMRGDEEYKYRLGGQDRQISRVQIHRELKK